MADVIIRTGCLPYDDGSGFALNIVVEAPSDYFKYERIVLNPDSEFTDFPVEKWPEVKAAIDRAVNARRQLDVVNQKGKV